MTKMRLIFMTSIYILLNSTILYQQAVAQTSLDIAYCLHENTTSEDEDIFRKMMAYALLDDEQELRKYLSEFFSMILRLAIAQCNLNFNQLEDEQVKRAFEMYGQQLGEKVVIEAFGKLGIE